MTGGTCLSNQPSTINDQRSTINQPTTINDQPSTTSDQEVLIRVENVSKKFCRSLKRSLWYGLCDITRELNPFVRSAARNGEVVSCPLPVAGNKPSPITHHPSTTNDHQSTNNNQPTTTNDQPSTNNHQLPSLRPDEFWAVKDVSFELRRGECLGLIGHNGAGKSTLLKILNGLIPPDSGRITMRGRVAALIELNAGFNPILTGRENIYNQAALLGFSKEETDAKFDAIVEFSEIGEFLDMPVQNYSSGMKVRLGFAVAAQMEPDVLIIDEVLAVGDVAFRFKCLNAIGELMKSAAVIFVTHTMPQVFRICSEAIVLDHGVVTCHSKNVADAVEVYLSLFKGTGVNVTGSGEVSFSGVRLEGPNGNAGSGGTLEISYGDSLRLRARVEGVPGISEARVQFLLWNSEMLPVMDIMTDELAGYCFPLPPSGKVDLTAFIPRLELGTGKYSLSVIAISEDKLRVFCRHDNAAYVQVTAATASGAQVLSVAEWCVRYPQSSPLAL